jgi:hypothetical protein
MPPPFGSGKRQRCGNTFVIAGNKYGRHWGERNYSA